MDNALPGTDPSLNGPPRGPHAFTNLFHTIGRALTQYKDVVTVTPETPAREAIRLLERHRFSQMPVVERGQVTGLFSYRSYSLAVVNAFDVPGRHRTDGLSVWECIETPAYVQGADEFHRLFDELDRRDVVLVGSQYRCEGIVTAMGVLRYLFEAASPFLCVAEIELSLRALIELAVGRDELPKLAGACLPHYPPESVPTLQEMLFNDYVILIGHGDNWERFNGIFMADRARTRARLEQARDLRNDIFHFRRELAAKDREALAELRRWMLRLLSLAGDVPAPAIRL